MPRQSPRHAARNRKAASALGTALSNKISGAKKAVVSAASDVMSAPARAYNGAKSAQASRDFNTLKRARSYDNAPNFDRLGRPSDALKARTSADEVRMRRQ